MKSMNAMQWIKPDWPAPENVRSAVTLRQGGVSQQPFDSLNLGDHVGDNPNHVEQNRETVKAELGLPEMPPWLTQVHGTVVFNADNNRENQSLEADAIGSHQANKVCAVMTADCLPVLFCTRSGNSVAAAHAGWKGLHAGVLEDTVKYMNCDDNSEIFAWLGPAIGPNVFEVGDEVREAFMKKHLACEEAFVAREVPGKWLADIYHLARIRLKSAGVQEIYGGGECTYSDHGRFYSYRRESVTGRMASLVWRAW